MIAPAYDRHGVTVHAGDCLDVLRELDDASVDAVVCDPPYGLAEHRLRDVAGALAAWLDGDRERVPDGKGFMGRDWDRYVPPPAVWDECLRVLKPGGHLLAFAGSRTADLMGLSVRMAGFEIRDTIMWTYGSGFPKSLDVSKAIDKARDDRADILRVTGWLAEHRDRAGWTNRRIDEAFGFSGMAGHWTAAPHLKIAQVPQWEQWQKLRELIGFGDEMDAEVWRLNGRKGTPGNERADRVVTTFDRDTYSAAVDVVNAGTPVLDAARQWQGWGTALKPAHEPIVLARKPLGGTVAATVLQHGTGAINIDATRVGSEQRINQAAGNKAGDASLNMSVRGMPQDVEATSAAGRWPSNVLLTHAPGCGPDEQPGPCVDGCPVAELDAQSGALTSGRLAAHHARAPKDAGILGAYGSAPGARGYGDTGGASRFFPVFRWEAKAPTSERPQVDGISHPTVKPIDLMRWLVRLVTPPGGLVLDPFAGSGTTLHAARAEGLRALGIEREPDYVRLIAARLDARERQAVAVPAAVAAAEPLDLLDLLAEDAS